MKIKQYQIDPKTWTKDVTCPYCNSILEIEVSDIEYTSDPGDYRDPGWERYAISCAACDSKFSLDEKELPTIIKKLAQKNKK